MGSPLVGPPDGYEWGGGVVPLFFPLMQWPMLNGKWEGTLVGPCLYFLSSAALQNKFWRREWDGPITKLTKCVVGLGTILRINQPDLFFCTG